MGNQNSNPKNQQKHWLLKKLERTESTTRTSSSTESTATAEPLPISLSDAEINRKTYSHMLSIPERQLFIEPHFIAFSIKNNYEKAQWTTLTLRNTSTKEWVLFQLQHYSKNDILDSIRKQMRHPLAIVPLRANPPRGLIPPGESVQLKVYLGNHLTWLCRRDAIVGKTTILRIRQMCINDPHEMFRGLEEEKQINDRIKRLFEILDYDPDDRVEKVYLKDIHVMIPRVDAADEDDKTAKEWDEHEDDEHELLEQDTQDD